MTQLRTLYAIARADFLERTRRTSFVVNLGLMLYIGYLVNIGKITLRLDNYRGIFNSAWIGSMMTLVVTFMLGWFGFYLVKNAIQRDYQTGVGQIMATTPITKPQYLFGKWLSNMAVLDLMVLILALASLTMQLIHHEAQIQIWTLLAPFVFIALPFMALIGALAVLFESISWLRGSFGNIVYFFFFLVIIVFITLQLGETLPILDWLGFGLFKTSMGTSALAAYPSYNGGITLSFVPNKSEILTFVWPGVNWTLTVIWPRLMLIVLSTGIVLVSTVFFDRFTQVKPIRNKSDKKTDKETDHATQNLPEVATVVLEKAKTASHANSFFRLVFSELRLILNEMPRWWYLIWVGLIAVSLFISPVNLTAQVLPLLLIWPSLIWSKLGCREKQFSTTELVFSTPRPLIRQLASAWLAGFIFSLLTGLGALFRFALALNWIGFATFFVGLLFIPSLALGLGVISGSSKTFEVIYAFFWYLGVMNDVSELDFSGLHNSGNSLIYLILSILLLGFALYGRHKQICGHTSR